MTVTARYAADKPAPATSELIELALAHRSVRKFTPDAVTDSQLRALVATAQSASTSSNLQPWSVIAIRDPEHKARVAALANSQQFIYEAPLFLVWVADLGRARRLAQRSGRPLAGADYLEATLIASIDTALAAQNAALAAESLGLGIVYVGAVRNHPEEIAAELDLPSHAYAVFGMAVGKPDPNEDAGVKPRLPQDAVLHQERYDAPRSDAQIPTYDQRLAGYNARYGLAGNWSRRVLARLAGPESLHGRDRLRDALERLGMPSR